MRIRRLDLLRYGRFTDVPLELPACNPDIHIIFGPNEAGKSTALSAMEDLLFGIPHNSPFNFLHDYSSMRIGAVLEKDGETLEVRRRKGKKDTLLTPDENPIPTGDGALASFLAGADRSFCERMFSLDHERLRQGGREILKAQDEVGQMLFSAGAGIAGLSERLRALDEEADALWAPRRAARRKYYQADERLLAATRALRDHTVTARRWQELKRSFETVQEACKIFEQDIEGKSVELRKLSRIRRVYRDVHSKSELDTTITALGEVTPLPMDAGQTLESAEREDATTSARIETLTDQIENAQRERAALTCDEALLLREQDIEHLHERRIEVRAGKADLPKRRAELASAEANLRRLAIELEWEAGDIGVLVARIPARSKLAAVRTLLNQRGERDSAVESAKGAAEEAEAMVAELRQQLDDMGLPVDVSMLAAVVTGTRATGDIGSRAGTIEGEAQDTQAAIERHLRLLKPVVTDEEALATMPVPPRDSVQVQRDMRRDLDKRMQVCDERIGTAQQELARQEKARERVTRDEDAVAPEDLARVRDHRDTGWSLVRRRYVDGASVPDEDVDTFTGTDVDLADAYETAVHDADGVADRRFDKAKAAAKLAVISGQIAEQEDLLDDLGGDNGVLVKESQALDAAWQEMWSGVSLSTLSPDAMLEWMTARAEVLDLVERRIVAEGEASQLRREESEANDRLLAELETLGVDLGSLRGQPLRVTLEAAADVQRGHERNAETRHQLAEGTRKAGADVKRKRKALKKAERAWSDWESQWIEALSVLRLDAAASPEAVSAQVDAIDEMREIVVRVNELRHERIGKIERDVAAFDRDVEEIIGAVAADLAEAGREDAVLELEHRLDAEKRTQEQQKEKDEAIDSLGEKVEEFEQSRRGARESIRHLQEKAGVESIDELKARIEKSDRLRDLQADLSRVTETLTVEGDGLSIAELEEECGSVDLDHIAAREQALEQDLEELRDRLMEAREERTAARQEFNAIGGDDTAAKDAADRQEALAEMQGVAEQYVRVRSSVLLLRWAIDRYQREKQAPLLKRAGQLFETITCGSFSTLRVDFDEHDRVHMIGVRPEGAAVGVEGMSTGARDQLYLALRIASVEDFLERASPLPFVADDLFINFDDARAAAGFQVLGQLAQKTQVLFFTHHQHLVDIARSIRGLSVSVTSLPEISVS